MRRIHSRLSYPSPPCTDKRNFLKMMGSAGLIALTGGLFQAEAALRPEEETPTPVGEPEVLNNTRRDRAFQVRLEAAKIARDLPIPPHPTNGDEERYPNRIASFSKGFPSNGLGEVNLRAYDIYLEALNSGSQGDFERIPLAGKLKLLNPLAGGAFELVGADSHALYSPPAPRFDSTEQAADLVEGCWMAYLRDIAFFRYVDAPQALRAIEDLNRLSNFKGPKEDGVVTPRTLFRGNLPGTLDGPYVSQFLLLEVPYGAQPFTQQNRTAAQDVDYVTSYPDWLALQRGNFTGEIQFDPVRRFIRAGRDLGEMVHNDIIFQEYLNAAIILMGMNAPYDSGNPYVNSRTMEGFGTFGHPYFTSMLGELSLRALDAAWFQKWFVHRRLRPEALSGRAHNVITRGAPYPINEEALNSDALQAIFSKYGTYLLPQAFPEGAPLHPCYPSGHSVVAGACVTFLKAFFDEDFVIPNPVYSNNNGTRLLPFSGTPLTVGRELNKLATNVGMGRCFGGVHYRSDLDYQLGEAVAIEVLREMRESGVFSEDFSGFNLTLFNGITIKV
jgi:hypothetical protein